MTTFNQACSDNITLTENNVTYKVEITSVYLTNAYDVQGGQIRLGEHFHIWADSNAVNLYVIFKRYVVDHWVIQWEGLMDWNEEQQLFTKLIQTTTADDWIATGSQGYFFYNDSSTGGYLIGGGMVVKAMAYPFLETQTLIDEFDYIGTFFKGYDTPITITDSANATKITGESSSEIVTLTDTVSVARTRAVSVTDTVTISDSIVSSIIRALIPGTNCAFVQTIPTADPEAIRGLLILDNRIACYKYTAPTGCAKITRIGYWVDSDSEPAGSEVGIYAADGTHYTGSGYDYYFPGTKLTGSDCGKGAYDGWVTSSTIGLDVTAGTDYWIVVQLDDTVTTTYGNLTPTANENSPILRSGGGMTELPATLTGTSLSVIEYGDAAFYARYGGGNKSLSETIILTDSIGVGVNLYRGLSDTITLTDSLNLSKYFNASGSDTITLSEVISIEHLGTYSKQDTITLTDTVYVDNTPGEYGLSDTITLSENVYVELSGIYNKSFSENVNLTDTFSRGSAIFNKGLLDTITLTDLARPTSPRNKYFSETMTVTDSITAGLKSVQGNSNQDTLWVKNSLGIWVEFPYFDYFTVKKTQNQINEFEIQLFDVSTAQKSYFKEFAEVMLFCGTTMVLKGRIQTIEYKSAYEVVAKGYGMEIELADKQFIVAGDNRVEYSNISAKDIIVAINNGIMSTTSTGIFATDYGNISMRYEYANRLNALGATCDAMDYYWWISQTSSDTYSANYLNVASVQGNTSSVKTFNLSDSAEVIEQENDTSQLVNYVYALGYGDGINQITTSVYAASTQSSFLSANILATNSVISCSSITPFDSTGSVRIAAEIVTYLGKDTANSTLTGCTRGASSTTAKAHNKLCYLEQHFTTGSAQTGSSIEDYGVMDYTLIDRTIINTETLEVVASGYLSDHKTPIQTIKIKSDEPLTDAALNIGDIVTVTSSEANINGTYNIVSQEFVDNYGALELTTEVSNKSLEFIEQMKRNKEEQDNLAKYMQGATNIYCIPYFENIDSSHAGYIRFYLPTDCIALNEVKLNFKMKNYRSNNTSVSSAPSFKQRFAGWFSNGVAFAKGNFTTTDNVASNLSLSSRYFLNYDGSLYDYNPEDFADDIGSDGVVNSWWNLDGNREFVATSGTWYGTRAVTSYTDNDNIVSGWTNITWDSSIFTKITAPSLTGTFDKIKVMATVHNGFDSSKSPLIYLKRETSIGSGTYSIIDTYTPTIAARGYYFIDYEDSSNYQGYSYKLETDTTSFPVNQTATPDTSYMLLNVTTYVKTTDTIVYGIYENTSEFTPPGTIIVSGGVEGAESALATYTADQEEVDCTSIIPTSSGNWYAIKFDSNHANNTSFGGRMRIEGNLYVKMFIQS